jgi:uncharacterized protein (TIGR03437 family)
MRSVLLLIFAAAALSGQQIEYLPRLVSAIPAHVGPDGSLYAIARVGCSKFLPCQRWVVYRYLPNGEYDGLTDLFSVTTERPHLVRVDGNGLVYAAGVQPDGAIWLMHDGGQGQLYPRESPPGVPIDLRFDSAGNVLMLVQSPDYRGGFLVRLNRDGFRELSRVALPDILLVGLSVGPDGIAYVVGNKLDRPIVTRISPDGSRTSLEIRSSGRAWALSTAAAPDGGVYVAGAVTKQSNDFFFPTTEGAWQRSPAGQLGWPFAVGFIARIDAALTRIERATLLGGDQTDAIAWLGVDREGRVLAAGVTNSLQLPSTGIFRTQCGPDRGSQLNNGMFLARFDASLKDLQAYTPLRDLQTASPPAFSPAGEAYWFFDQALHWSPDQRPTTGVACVMNADYHRAYVVAAHQLLTIFGEGFADRVRDFSQDDQLPLSADQLTVELGLPGFNLRTAPILAVTPTQVNVVLPALDFQGDTILQVRRGNEIIHQQAMAVSGTAPVALIRVSPDGKMEAGSIRGVTQTAMLADVLNQDGQPNSRENPARPGELVTLFATGFGALSPEVSERGKGTSQPAHPRLPVYLETPDGAIIPEDISTVPGRTTAVLQIRFRIPRDFAAPELGFGFTPVKDGNQVRPFFLHVRPD